MVAVSVEKLSKRYGDFEAVKDVAFEVDEGEVFALLGPNGAGKTTTIEILEGFRNRDGGRVRVLGFDPADRSTARLVRERMGVVLQELAVEPFLSVRQVLERNAGYYPNPRSVEEVLDLVGLDTKANHRVKSLSGGQQRRLDLALGIIGDPVLLFLDEPTTGFDPSARRDAWDVIRALTGKGTTVILTTHYMEEAQALADQAAVMSEGKIVATGPPRSLGADHAAVIRFRLPGPPGGSLPPLSGLGPVAGEAGAWELRTSRPTADLHALTGWALEHGVDLASLSVSQPTLEDVYLQLTAPEEAGATSS
jgi:ABC-2 type transport system ATP-binding protein